MLKVAHYAALKETPEGFQKSIEIYEKVRKEHSISLSRRLIFSILRFIERRLTEIFNFCPIVKKSVAGKLIFAC